MTKLNWWHFLLQEYAEARIRKLSYWNGGIDFFCRRIDKNVTWARTFGVNVIGGCMAPVRSESDFFINFSGSSFFSRNLLSFQFVESRSTAHPRCNNIAYRKVKDYKVKFRNVLPWASTIRSQFLHENTFSSPTTSARLYEIFPCGEFSKLLTWSLTPA